MRRFAGTALAFFLMLSASPSTANASAVTPTNLTSISTATQKSTAYQDQALTMAEHSRKVQDTLALYSGFTFNRDVTGTVHGDRFSWASFTGTKPGDKATIQVRVAISNANQSIVTVQHVKMHSVSGGIHISVRFDNAAPIWEGITKEDGTTLPDPGYGSISGDAQGKATPASIHNYTQGAAATLKTPDSNRRHATGWSCRDVIGNVCNAAASGDMTIACAILTSSGLGAVGCGVAGWVIVTFGCAKLTSMVCD